MMRPTILARTVSALAIASAASMAAPGFAQTVADDESGDEEGLGVIVVTAQTRNQQLQDVPIQVSAFGEEQIADAGIDSTQDFMDLVPNVSFDDSFTYLNSFVVVRGVTQINNADSPVAVIVDGVPQNSQKQLKMNLFDLERIEVLKGPQGGLYGRNAIGGAINIVTKRPGDEFSGMVQATYGRGDFVDLNAAISTPIGDSSGLRVSGNYISDGGRIENSFTGKNVDFVDHDYTLRGRFVSDIGAATKLDLRASYRDFQAGGIYDSQVRSGNADDIVYPAENIEGLTFGDIVEGAMKWDFEIGNGTLTSISAYTDLAENVRGDLDFSNAIDDPGGFAGLGIQAGQGQDLSVELMSQELRYVSDDALPFRWIAGVYYLHTNRDLLTRAFIDAEGTAGGIGSRDQIDNPALRLITLNESNRNDAYAVYSNFEYDLTGSLILSGALRYDLDERRQTDLENGGVRSESFSAVQPKVTLTYRLDDDKLVYGTYSTGFRSGGFNAPTVSIPVYQSEYLQNFEAGFKSSWMNNRLILNGAVYFAKSDDFQFFYIDALSASQIIGNIDRVDIFGVELEMQALVADGLQIFAALGTTDTQIKEYALDPSFIGNHTPKSTSFTGNLGFQYKAPISDTFDLLVRADYEHRGKKYWQVDNLDVQGPLNLLGARIGIENDRMGLFLSASNIFDEKYYADYNPKEFSGLTTDIGFLAQPSTWAIEATLKF
ncbi:TonB-dependent receptor [Citromicrobium bathyomarinum]|uniref:TonB-dependent receptor n=1 Tax=Citromicrobium bathyomarinum TaxID=72174 RepID=UPI001E4D084B|nr:TonB-dependent receptor [Citromicrobium bathyomarinum]